MGRLTVTAALGAALLVCSGCRIVFHREKDGVPRPIQRARDLKPGKDTLRTTLAKVGSPTLIMRFGEGTRVYYTFWDRRYTRVQIDVPLRGGPSPTAFIWTTGTELFELARLDFDAAGVLRQPTIAEIPLGASGYYGATDTRLLRFFEDQRRALYIEDAPDDDD